MNAININAVLVAFLIYNVSGWTSQASIKTVPCALNVWLLCTSSREVCKCVFFLIHSKIRQSG